MSCYYLKDKVKIGDKLKHCLAEGSWTVIGYDKKTNEFTVLWDKDNKKYHYSEEILRHTFGKCYERRELSNDVLKAIVEEVVDTVEKYRKDNGYND